MWRFLDPDRRLKRAAREIVAGLADGTLVPDPLLVEYPADGDQQGADQCPHPGAECPPPNTGSGGEHPAPQRDIIAPHRPTV